MNKVPHFLLIFRNTLLKKRNLVFRKSRYKLHFEIKVDHKLAQVELLTRWHYSPSKVDLTRRARILESSYISRMCIFQIKILKD